MRKYISSAKKNYIAKLNDKLNQQQVSLNSNTLLIIILAFLIIILVSGSVILNSISDQPTVIKGSIVHAEDSQNTIIENKAIQSMSATYTGEPLHEGDIVNTDDILFEVKYNDGSTGIIDNNKLIFPDNINDPLISGTNAFTLQYNNTKCAFIVKTEMANMALEAIDKYADEIENAYISDTSENLFITLNKYDTPDIYWMAHIITSNNNFPIVTMANNEFGTTESLIKNNAENNGVLCINASYSDKNNKLCSGTYINDKTVYQDENTTGNELCITSTGEMFTPDTNITPDELINKYDVAYTILSENPIMIKDGERCHLNIKNNKVPKTVIGMVKPGEYYIIITDSNSQKTKITYQIIQSLLYEKGCVYAKAVSNSDAVALALNGQIINNVSSENNPLFDILLFK